MAGAEAPAIQPLSTKFGCSLQGLLIIGNGRFQYRAGVALTYRFISTPSPFFWKTCLYRYSMKVSVNDRFSMNAHAISIVYTSTLSCRRGAIWANGWRKIHRFLMGLDVVLDC